MRACILLSLLIVEAISDTNKLHEDKRTKLLEKEFKLTLGGNIILNNKEAEVNKCLMEHKNKELKYDFDHPAYYNLSRHFFLYKDKIRQSKVYKIIKDMPKGAVLHVHDMGILGPDYLINVTYKNDLYVCLSESVKLRFADKTPDLPCSSRWILMSEARKMSTNVTAFDAELRKKFTLVVEDPDVAYASITDTWSVFMNYFGTVEPLLSYRPVWEQYFYDVLKVFRELNMMYVEVRSVLPVLYELDGTTYDQLVTAKAYRKATNRFVRDYPDFVGAKLIFAPNRHIGNNSVIRDLEVAKDIKRNLRNFFAGFDLVGQEDIGYPLIDFIQELEDAGKELNYFFHAGETNWYGTGTDENLVDAILLGTKRIGHAYALPKHPLLMKEVENKQIAIEVNVVSNAVLSLVHDIRNHPLSIFFANDLPVVISSDDPGAWEANPITDDFYIAFIGVASKLSDLRMLKKLALNSLEYSALENDAKTEAMIKFNKKWNYFINKFNCSSY